MSARKPSSSERPTPPADAEGRERILSAALRSFAERGFDGTTTAGVARAAGVTQPLVHHHFGSKKGLWQAAMDALFSEVRMFTSFDPQSPSTDALLHVVERFVRLCAARPELPRIISRESAQPGPRLTYLVDRHLRSQYQEIATALRQQQAVGAIDPKLRPELLIYFVTGAASHLFDIGALAKEALGVDVDRDQTLQEFVALTLSVLRSGVVRTPKV